VGLVTRRRGMEAGKGSCPWMWRSDVTLRCDGAGAAHWRELVAKLVAWLVASDEEL
jgi:hypothetical protein